MRVATGTRDGCCMVSALSEIFEEFADLDREDQSRFLLELVDEIPELPAEHRTEVN